MSSTLVSQQETAEKIFYAAVGAPVVIGQKAQEFATAVLKEISFEDLEAAGRDFATHLQDSKVVEQIQDTMDVELFQEKVDLLREQLETLLISWRDQFDLNKESVKIEVEDPAPKKTATTTKKKATSTAKKTTTTAKKTTPDK